MKKRLAVLPLAALAFAAACGDTFTEPGAFTPNNSPLFSSSGGVSGAAFTTTNPAEDGTGHCKNGNEAVNCNIYDGKDFVWLNGGPTAASLGNGIYFFAVLSPGGQPSPNDGGINNANGELANLSDNHDLYTNRTFTVSGGTVSYSGSHDFSNNKIRLMPYADTPNKGGVYIMAICRISTPSSYPVNPRDCKYDAFKIREGDGPPDEEGTPLTAIKTANASYSREYRWEIDKGATEVSRSSGSWVFKYTVTVEPGDPAFTDSDHAVSGTITIFNLNPFAVVARISDEIDGTVCTLDDAEVTVPGEGQIEVEYTCEVDEDGTNVATIEWDETASGLIELAKGETEAEAEFEFGDPTKETNETVTVTDTFDGGSSITLGTVSVGGAGTVTVPTPAGISNLAYAAYVFTYRRTIATVADRCIDYKNTAEIVETEQTDDATVGVCGRISGGNTIGFWGNKNGKAAIDACINAGTPVYSILTGMNLVNAKGQDFNPSNHSGFNSWLQSADAANMSYMLSAQMAATWLNVNCGVNGRKMDGELWVTDPANPSSAITINEALEAANMFLGSNKNTTASGPARTLAEAYKSLFDRLNNGLVVVVVLP